MLIYAEAGLQGAGVVVVQDKTGVGMGMGDRCGCVLEVGG